jgi:Ca2+-binding RTX toxin-like protein
MLELINAARKTAGVQPLAFDLNSSGSELDLNQAAEGHSKWMIANDIFSHTGVGGSNAQKRMTDAGYQFSGSWTWGENIAWTTTGGAAGLQDEVQKMHTNLMNSSGHRANIENGNFREIGIGIETGAYKSYDSTAFVTQNFAKTASKNFLTGVVFSDKDTDKSYDIGEGVGGLTVTAKNAAGQVFSTKTMSAGGYQLELADGTYTLTFSGTGYTTTTQTVSVAGKNVKVDLVNPGAGSTTSEPTSAPPPSSSTSSEPTTISGNSYNNTLYGTEGANLIQGAGGSDSLYGRGGNDRLEGGTGSDRLYGEAGDDTLRGDSGRDTLDGGAGRDILTGGSDVDTFRFVGTWGNDRVTDFQNGYDKIDLRSNGLSYAQLNISQGIDADGDSYRDDAVVQANGQSIELINMSGRVDAGDFWFT